MMSAAVNPVPTRTPRGGKTALEPTDRGTTLGGGSRGLPGLVREQTALDREAPQEAAEAAVAAQRAVAGHEQRAGVGGARGAGRPRGPRAAAAAGQLAVGRGLPG